MLATIDSGERSRISTSYIMNGCPVRTSPIDERCGASALLLALLLGVAACGDDTTVNPPRDTETGTTGSTDTVPQPDFTSSGADTTASATIGGTGTSSSGSDSGTTGSSTGDTDSTTGEPAIPGSTMSQLVSAGTRTGSSNYTLVHTLGQPSALQSTHESASYRLQGGLVGANGSPP